MTVVFADLLGDNPGYGHSGDAKRVFVPKSALYIGAEVFDIASGKDYIVVNVESDWTAELAEVEE